MLIVFLIFRNLSASEILAYFIRTKSILYYLLTYRFMFCSCKALILLFYYFIYYFRISFFLFSKIPLLSYSWYFFFYSDCFSFTGLYFSSQSHGFVSSIFFFGLIYYPSSNNKWFELFYRFFKRDYEPEDARWGAFGANFETAYSALFRFSYIFLKWAITSGFLLCALILIWA